MYALDLGGTNFRVKHVKLSKTKSEIESEDSTEVSIPKVGVRTHNILSRWTKNIWKIGKKLYSHI